MSNENNENIYNYTDLIDIIDNYHFSYMMFEDINDGIKKFDNILEVNTNKIDNAFWKFNFHL